MTRRYWFSSLLVVAAIAAGGCAAPRSYNLPPAERLLEPGPGVGGPGPGVLPPLLPMMGPGVGAPAQTVQILFSDANQMEGLQVRWDVGAVGMFDSEPLVTPGRTNFPQDGIYRLKLTNVPGHVGSELYPTVEVAPVSPRTEAYLAHNAIPIQFTNEDFDQVESNNYVTKVIYLPDPEFQELAQAGIETLVSTRLDPGVDPIDEADRRGAILAIVRMGNKDVEMPGATGDAAVVGVGHEGGPMAMGPAGMSYPALPNHVAGVTAPNWGMPYSGTPIGLPGPPHIPFGGPATLQKHWIKNHTHEYYPEAPHSIGMHVRQQPGYSYPRPASRVHITEQNIHAPQVYRQPRPNMSQHVH